MMLLMILQKPLRMNVCNAFIIQLERISLTFDFFVSCFSLINSNLLIVIANLLCKTYFCEVMQWLTKQVYKIQKYCKKLNKSLQIIWN